MRSNWEKMDEALKKNLIDQQNRLIEQLEDLESNKEDLSTEEYEEMKADTIKQLKEFEASLEKMTAGNMTLQTELEATRMAIRAAISDAFKTPEVLRLFANKEGPALRRRLAEMDRDVKLGKLDSAVVAEQATEILVALKKLGEPLAPKEEAFLQQHKSAQLSDFEAVAEDSGDTVKNLPSAGPS